MGFGSLYVGATGVVAHGDRMQVVANNLANVNTVGFKKSEAYFADLMSQQVAGASARYSSGANYVSQMGRGVALGEVRHIFKEGSLENSTTVTDLAVTGQGFFGVRGADSAETFYTRAGNFRFDNDAYLVNPSDLRLQGYQVDRETGQVSAAISDVQLPYEDVSVGDRTVRVVRSLPRATTSLEMVSNLDFSSTDNFTSSTDPFFAMLESYDATLSNGAPFGGASPAYSSSLNVYDADGNPHALTVYFDPVSANTVSNAATGYTYWEYLIAVPGDQDGSAAYGTSGAGLVGAGMLTFNGQGQLVGQSAFSSQGSKNLGDWQVASLSSNGTPTFDVTFGANGSPVGTTQNVSYDFGISSSTNSWEPGAQTASNVGLNTSAFGNLANITRDARSTTSYDSGSVTLYSIQDGFTDGELQNVSVDREGFLTGHFSNGQSERLYQIALYRFNSEFGLRAEGSNVFRATEASGAAISGKVSEGGRGTIQQNTLETSNVDMAEQFADMILTQRGYQSNTKVITTADSLLSTTISTKR